MKVKKINKRLFLVDDNDQIIYTPPDFIMVIDRSQLEALGRAITLAEKPIDAIIAFESTARRRK